MRSEAGVSKDAATLAKLARRLKAVSHFARSALPPLWFLTDEERLVDPLAAARNLPSGTGIVFRHYHAADRRVLARSLAKIARERGLTLLIGADVSLAAEVGAHGVHFPRWALRQRARPRVRGLVTGSAHGFSELGFAQAIGVDAVFLGPVFPTESHKSAQTLGPVRFSALVAASSLPVLALGGVSTGTSRLLLGSGAMGFGAIGALLPATEQ